MISTGSNKLVLFEKSAFNKWVVVKTIVKDVAFANARSIGWLIVGISAVVVAVLLAGIWALLSFNVSRPVASLIISAKSIADGNHDVVLDVTRKR